MGTAYKSGSGWRGQAYVNGKRKGKAGLKQSVKSLLGL